MRILGWIVALWLSVNVAQAQTWFEATTPRVRVIAKGNEEAARSLAERLEKFDSALRLSRGIESVDHGPAARLTVYVVDSTSQIARLANSAMTAGFYLPRAGGSVAFVPRRNSGGPSSLNAEAVLLHEYAHHFMFRNFPSANPGWLTEGFAEFNATARFDRDGSITIGYAPMYRAHSLINGIQLPIERLLEPGSRAMRPAEVDNFYGRGWLLTHYLTFSKEREGQLGRYIAALQGGASSLEAAKQAFGDLRSLDRELDRYTSQKLSGWRIGADRLGIAPIAVRAMTDGESAMMDIHIESTSGVTRDEALGLLPRARRAAAPFPNAAFAQGVLAEAEYDAGHYAAARDAALRALAADPQSRQGLLYHGMALAALAREAKDVGSATYRAVIAPWVRANRLDPDDPRPMMLIYFASREFGQQNASVVDGIKYAQSIAPEDRGLRMTAASEYIREGKLDTARPLIASLVYDPHAGNRERMATLLALIDAGDRDGASAALARPGNVQPETGIDGDQIVSRFNNARLRSAP